MKKILISSISVLSVIAIVYIIYSTINDYTNNSRSLDDEMVRATFLEYGYEELIYFEDYIEYINYDEENYLCAARYNKGVFEFYCNLTLVSPMGYYFEMTSNQELTYTDINDSSAPKYVCSLDENFVVLEECNITKELLEEYKEELNILTYKMTLVHNDIIEIERKLNGE